MRLKISNFGASLALIFVFFIGIVHSFEMADVVSLTDKWVEIVNVGKGFLEKATDISETNTLFAEALIPVAAAVALAKKIGTDAESKELIAIDQLRSVLVHDIGELKDVVVDEKYAAIYRDALDKFDEKVTLPIIKTITSIVAVLDPNVIDSSSDEKELLKQCPNVMDIYQYLEHVVERHCAKSNFPTKESKQVQASALAFFHKLEADKFVNYEPQMAGHKEYQVMKSSVFGQLVGLSLEEARLFLSGLQELVSSLPLAKYSNLSQFRHDFLDKTSTLSFNRDDIGPECMLLAVENNSHHDRDTMTDLVKHMTYHLAQVEVLQIVCIYKLYNLEADRLHKVDEFKDKIAKTMKATRKWVETSLALDFPAIFVKYAKQVATATKLEDENEYNRIAKAVNNRLSKLGLPDYHFQVLVSQADDELQTTHLAHNEARNFAVREHKGLNIFVTRFHEMEKRLVIPGTKHFDKHKKGIEKILHTDTVGQMDERTNKIIRELSENPIPDWFYAKGIVEAGMPFYYSILLMRRQNYFWFDPLNPSPIIVGLSVTSAPHLDKKNPLEIGESEHAYQTASVSSSPSWTISIQLFTVYCFI